MMRISKITMKNFRQYKDFSISFEKKCKYDLHFLIAENGIGKTTLLNAINWCLYGDEPHLGIKSQALPIMNLSSLREMKTGDIKQVSVEIEIEIQAGTVTFERKLSLRKTEEGQVYNMKEERKAVTLYEGKCANVCEDDEADKYVNKFVPKRIRKFFFFDGEQMDTYFTTETGVNVENSIFEIAQIDLLNAMYRSLSTISNELRREAVNLNPNVAIINTKYEKEEASRNELINNINQYSSQLKISRAEFKRCIESLGEEPDLADLEKRRNELDNEINKNIKSKTEFDEYLKAFVKRYTVLFYSLQRIKDLLSVIDEKEEQKQLPPKIDKEILQRMLEEHRCLICNRNLDGKSTLSIEELISQHELTNKAASILVSIRGNLESLEQEVNIYPGEKRKNTENIKNIDVLINNALIEKQEIDRTLDKYIDKDYIKSLHEERKKHEELINTNNKDLIIAQENLKGVEKKCEGLKEELDKELDKDKKQTSLVAEKDMSEKATKIIEKIIADMKGEVRDKISTEMSSVFFNLIWKTGTFGEVKLSDSYLISLQNVDGYECLGTCSAAERELLALSFTLALHKESGFDAPLVIDTPLSRISGVLRKNFAKILREISSEKQIILYLTEDEYSIAVRDIFEPSASSKYRVNLIDENYAELRCI